MQSAEVSLPVRLLEFRVHQRSIRCKPKAEYLVSLNASVHETVPALRQIEDVSSHCCPESAARIYYQVPCGLCRKIPVQADFMPVVAFEACNSANGRYPDPPVFGMH